jgi:hypothetical protein
MLRALGRMPGSTMEKAATARWHEPREGVVMIIERGVQGRVAVTPVAAGALLGILLMTAMTGCGTRQADQASTGSTSQDQSSSQVASSEPNAVVATADEPVATRRAASRSRGSAHRIILSDRGCVRFDPQWTNVHVGQAITWHSELKEPMRIYVTPGIFSRESFLIRPGATVTTGPALAPGRYSFWTEPNACREAPRGVLLAGPGVRVQETFYASAPALPDMNR